ncbi:MAG: TFIIB-type zinc ribbon-containing protein, partial [Lacrimispora sphenoides]
MSEIISYKCPNCGGPLIFDPKKQKYACEYCLSEFNQKETESGEPQEPKTQKKSREPEAPKAKKQDGEPVLYTCP